MKSKFSVAALVFVVITGCSNSAIVGQKMLIANPDSSMLALVEEVDNGLGFGQGALYSEVHLVKPGVVPSEHGDSDDSVVFYAESNYGKGKDISITWLSNKKLQITYDPQQKPGKQLASYQGISIVYITYPPEAK